MRFIKVCRHRDAVSDPDPGRHGRIEERKRVFLGEPGQAVRGQDSSTRFGRRILEPGIARQLLEDETGAVR